MKLSATHESSRCRFVARVDGHECTIDYFLSDDIMTITRTFVPPALRGRGIAGELTRFALDTARVQGWKVVPACSYAARWFAGHAEYRNLLA